MKKTVLLLAVLLCGVFLSQARAVDDLTLIKEVSDDLRKQNDSISHTSGGAYGTSKVYSTTAEVTLKSGAKLVVKASVMGDNRLVGIKVLDLDNKRLTPTYAKTATSEITLDPVIVVGATGKYKIILFSDRAGDCELKVFTDKPITEIAKPKGADVKVLEKRVDDLERRIKVLESRLLRRKD